MNLSDGKSGSIPFLQIIGSQEDEPMLLTVIDTPVRALQLERRLTKEELEGLHLRRFLALHDTGSRYGFAKITRGPDPPDFIVTTARGEHGLDCTVFASSKRRNASPLFNGLLKRLLSEAQASKFAHLDGAAVRISFGGGLELPTKDRQVIAEVVTLLSDVRVTPEAVDAYFTALDAGLPPGERPGVFPHFKTTSGMAEIDISFGQPLSGPFFEQTGFACDLQMQTTTNQSDVAEELQRLLTKHEHSGAKDLLVTVGGPDVNGYRHRAEETLEPLFERKVFEGLHRTRIDRIFVHFWSSGRLKVASWPKAQTLVG